MNNQLAQHEIQKAIRTSQAAVLQTQFPQLLPATTRHAGGVHAAKNIRTELKLAFPKVKFSVKSNYTSVNVKWTDGPTTAQVDAIVDKYQAGRFDGMTDCYEYSRTAWGDAFGDAKYVFTSRNYSDAVLARVIARIADSYGVKRLTVDEYRRGAHWAAHNDMGSVLHRALSRHTCALPKTLLALPSESDPVVLPESSARH